MTTQADHPLQDPRATALRVLKELEALQAEREALRAFAQGILGHHPEYDLNGFETQDLAVQHGLLEAVEATEPCAEDGACNCEEYGDFPLTCYRRTELLTGKEG